MEKANCLAELRFRLGLPDVAEEACCPTCDAVFDRFSHHDANCVAGDKRPLRHHAIRDIVFAWAQRAGLHPERECSRSLWRT